MEENAERTTDRLFEHAHLLDAIEHAIVASDRDGRVILWNRGAETMFGWPAADAIALDGIDLLVSPDQRSSARNGLADVIAGNHWAGDYQFNRRDGSNFWGQVSATPLRDSTGTVTGVVASIQDATGRIEAEERIRRIEDHRRLAAEASRAYTFERDLVTGAIEFADPVVNLTSVSLTSEADREEYYRRIHPADVQYVQDAISNSMDPGGPGSYDIEYRFIRLDGETRWFNGRGKTVFEGEGIERKPVRMVGMIMDITATKQAQQVIERKEERRSLAVKSATAFTYERNLVTGEIELDDNAYVLTGFPEGTAFDYEQFHSRIHPDDAPQAQEAIRQVVESGGPSSLEIEYRFIRPDGQERWFNSRAATFFDGGAEHGKPTRLLGMVTDITEMKRAQQVIERNEERLRFAVEAANSFTYERNLVSGELEFDNNIYVLTGFPYSSPISYDLYYSRIDPGDARSMWKALQDALQAGHPVTWEKEFRFIRPDGRVRWFNSKSATFFDGGPGQSKPTRIFGLVSDVTDRRRGEDARQFLSEASQILASSLDYNETLDRVVNIAVPSQADVCGVYLIQPDGLLQRVAVTHRDPAKIDLLREVTSYFPLPRDHVLQRVLVTGQSVLIPEVTEDSFAGLVRNSKQAELLKQLGQCSVVAVPLTAHGVTLGVLTLSATTDSGRIYDSSHLTMVEELGRRCGIAVDNARLYTKLADSERRLALTLQVSGVGFFERSYPPNEDFYLSDRIAEIFGVSRDELPPWHEYDRWLAHRIHPEDREAVLKASQQFQNGHSRTISLETRIMHSSGRAAWVRVLSHATAKDEEGHVTHATGVVMDITDLKGAEQALRESNQELELGVKERTAELEQLTRRLRLLASELIATEQRERRQLAQLIHDDLQQLLVAARMQVTSIPARGSEEETAESRRFAISLIDQAIEGSRSLTAQLRPPALYESGLISSLGWLAEWMKQAHGLNVVWDLDKSVEPLPEQVSVLLFDSVRELLLNVVKYAGVNEAKVNLHRAEGDMLRLSVSDAGRGFDIGILDTPRMGSGGLGLFSIRERMIVMGGRLDVRSAPGEGTTVNLLWPAAQRDTAATATGQPLQPRMELRQRSGVRDAVTRDVGVITVLLVDDHAVVRQGLASVLSAQPDIAVIAEASDGAEAVEAVEIYRPKVVVMDVNLPKLNGVQATRIIKERFPGVRLIGLSIHNDQAIKDSMLNAGASAYISKGGSTENLLEALRA